MNLKINKNKEISQIFTEIYSFEFMKGQSLKSFKAHFYLVALVCEFFEI